MASPVKVAEESVEPTRRQGGSLRVLLSPQSAGTTSGFMGTHEIPPNETINEHYHPYSDKFLFVVSGSLVVRTDDGEEQVDAHEAVLIPRNTSHRIANGPNDTFVVLHLGPLAPSPELGHVEIEEVAHPDEPHPVVGGPRHAS